MHRVLLLFITVRAFVSGLSDLAGMTTLEVIMYQTIREYKTNPQSIGEVLATDEKSFVPFIKDAPGFREYTCIDAGNGTVSSTSTFASQVDGEKFNTLAVNWVHENLSSQLPTPPRVSSGEVRTHVTGHVHAS
jgi:hypothetical protein